MVWEEMSFEELQDGNHGGYRTLGILNLCVAPIPPTQFRLNQTCGFGGDIF